ncbi:hypothetical protein [Alicyclobacillus ferrooxydans]|uniref:PA14 domain-containing protein n=1 Tax=Alicyclobacillus ferrooxydans TaxID=471514 RepID=A0A0P9EIP0_9BACL|nr:hypothetical protein [Alicyclobacillus ferrooxydans]KPV42692.1 hypothetical protein AN477_16305 [Alicyclobacillus ferrooxydans]
MRRRYKVTAIGLSSVAVFIGSLALANNNAYAYTVNNDLSAYGYVVQNVNTYTLMGGDTIKVSSTGYGPYPALAGQNLQVGLEQAYVSDGKGNWGIMLADMQGANANNGYLLVSDPSTENSGNAQAWVQRFGGNWSYVQNYLQTHNQQIQTQDEYNHTNYNYVPFATIVSQSGAIFVGNKQITGPIGTYTDPQTGQTYPEYSYTYPIETSNPPAATGLTETDPNTGSSTITQGDPIQFSASSDVYLFSQLSGGASGHHYDALEITNQATGQSYWAVGSGTSNISSMQSMTGGSGVFDDVLTYNSANLQPGTYTASFWVGDAVDRISSTDATTTFTVTTTKPGPGVTLTASPTSLTSGQASSLSAKGYSVPSGDYIKIIDESGAGTLSGSNTYADLKTGETSLTTTATSSTAQTVAYEAELINQATGQVDATSSPVSVTWATAPVESIKVTANPTLVQSGQASTVSYTTSNMQPGDTVHLVGVGTSQPFETTSTLQGNSYIQVQTPSDGNSVTVYYSATIQNSSGQVVASSPSVAVTWKSIPPSIILKATPNSPLRPGQTDSVTYIVSGQMGAGDTVSVTGIGNAANPWHTTGQTSYAESYGETENPTSGQTISETYTASIINPSGTVISSATVTVSWVDSWTGTITLSASPTHLPVQSPTTLSVSTSQSIPSGYTLYIVDETTGATVATSTSAPYSTQYNSFNPETDTFVAYLSDGYEQVGNSSNTVSVQWSQLSLSANPTELPAGQSTTLTVSGQNVPSGYYLTIYDQSTGQEVGYTQSTPYSVTVNQPSPETDTFVAYISSNTASSGSFMSSNTVSVTWYTVQLSATPLRLPVGQGTLLTASSVDIPSGYVLDILNQTNGAVLVTGKPGESTLTYIDTKNTPQTDTYVAQVVQPSNPGIPALTVPATVPTSGLFGQVAGSSNIEYYNPTNNTWVTEPTPSSGTGGPTGGGYQIDPSGIGAPLVYNPANQTLYSDIIWSTFNNQTYQIWNSHYMFGLNLAQGTWNQTSLGETQAEGFGYYEFPQSGVLDPANNTAYVVVQASGGTGSLYSIASNGTVQTSGTYPPYGRTNFYPTGPITVDTSNGTLYWVANNNNGTGGIIGWNPTTLNTINVDQNVANDSGWTYYPNSNSVAVDSVHQILVSVDTNYQTLSFINLSTFQRGAISLPNNDTSAHVFYDSSTGVMYLMNGTGIYTVNTTSESTSPISGSPGGMTSAILDSQLGGIVFSGSNGVWLYNGSSFRELGNLANAQVAYASGSASATNAVDYFPFWTFSNMPSYVPQSLFPSQAQSSGENTSAIWTTAASSPPNGTALFQGTFTLPQTETVDFSNFWVDDYGQVYIDGKPLMQVGDAAGYVGGNIPNTTGTSITLSKGEHQVIIEANNNNGFGNPSPNGAAAHLVVTANGQTLLTTANSWQWTTTGYVTQLPAGWFSGAVGTYNFTEYVLGELGTVVTQQASYSVQTTAQTVDLQSQSVSVTWYQYGLDLQASPTSLLVDANTTLSASAPLGAPGTSVIQIWNTTTNQMVGESSAGATTFTATTTRSTPGTDNFSAELIDPSSGSVYAQTSPVSVTWNQQPLTLSDALVTHTPHWLENLQAYNNVHPGTPRSLSEFWAGEELVFNVTPSLQTIASAQVTVSGLNYSNYAPVGAPSYFTVNLTLNSNGVLVGNTDPSWEPWFQYLNPGTYTATFWVKSQDAQTSTATATFTVNGNWTDFWKNTQVY